MSNNFDNYMERLYAIRISSIDDPNGFTMSFYLNGCDNFPKCTDCHNPELWQPGICENFSYNDVLTKFNSKVVKDLLVGISIMGGEPLANYNVLETIWLILNFKALNPDKRVFLYTWRYPKDAAKIISNINPDVLQFIDGGVFGPYEADKKCEGIPGSKNQILLMSNKEFIDSLLTKKSKTI